MKKVLCILLALFLAISAAACNGGSAPSSTAESTASASASAAEPSSSAPESVATDGAVIEVVNNSVLQSLDDVMSSILNEFTAETGIEVDYSTPGDGYEELMKTRMAANDMPDVFCTHGWAVVRYGEYLLPLNDAAWVGNISGAIKDVITDANGNLLVLPSSYVLFGIDCNYDVLAEAGVDANAILTWDDFADACEKVKAIGKTPISMGAKDSWMAAQPFQDLGPSTLDESDTAALADGTFDWNRLIPICEQYADWVERGFFNVDVLTADFSTACEMLATDAAFHFCDTGSISEAWTYVPDAKLGMIPIPAADPANSPIGIAGEYLSWGIWKDGSNIEASKTYLDFLAKPENGKRIAEATACPTGMDNIECDFGPLTEDFAKLAKYPTKPVWDRSLPSGMFNDLCQAGQSILAREDNAVSKAITLLKESYNEKMS